MLPPRPRCSSTVGPKGFGSILQGSCAGGVAFRGRDTGPDPLDGEGPEQLSAQGRATDHHETSKAAGGGGGGGGNILRWRQRWRKRDSKSSGVYLMRRQNRVAQYIATQPILDLCERSIWRPVAWVSMWWWEQEGLNLEGAKEIAAAESDREEEQCR